MGTEWHSNTESHPPIHSSECFKMNYIRLIFIVVIIIKSIRDSIQL